MDRTVAVWARSEASRPGRCEDTTTRAATDLEQRVGRYRRAEDGAAQWLRRDAQRWERRQRLYWEETGRILGGHPQRIEYSAVTLFY